MEQTRALNALQPYLALSKSATSPRAAADVIAQATSAPSTYVFAELLATPTIQNLKNASEEQYAAHYKLLEIFAWGTWADYNGTHHPLTAPLNLNKTNEDTANASTLPQLNPAQTHKLHLLTLLTLASTAPSSSTLTYTHLTQSLGLNTSRELEQLVTTAVYNSLLTATLDSKTQIVSVSSVAPLRDLAPGSLTSMISELAAWSSRCDSVLADLEAEVADVKRDAAARRAWEIMRSEQIAKAEEKQEQPNKGLRSGSSGLGRGRGGGGVPGAFEDEDEDLMDVDDAPGKGKKGGLGARFGRKR